MGRWERRGTGLKRQWGLCALTVPEAGKQRGSRAVCAVRLVGSNVGALRWDRVQLFVVPCRRKEPGRNCDWVTGSSWSASWGGAATGSPVQDWAWRLQQADCKYFAEVLFSGNYFNMIQCFLFCLILLMNLLAWSFACCRGSRASVPTPHVPFLPSLASQVQWLGVGAIQYNWPVICPFGTKADPGPVPVKTLKLLSCFR